MEKCVARGYDEALEREQFARSAAYLDLPEMVLGEPLKNITPHLLGVLTVSKSPFYIGRAFNYTHVAQFLWALHRDYRPGGFRAWWQRQRLRRKVRTIPLRDCGDAIAAYMDLQFMDAPKGGKAQRPIASAVAELVFRFRYEPWHQKESETIHIPIRRLYQEMKLWMREHDQTVTNKSDGKIAEWQARVNAWLAEDPENNQRELDEWNAKHRNAN